MRCSACFGANSTIFVAMTWYIYRGFQACLPILRCYRSSMHLEKSRMIYRLHELNHQLKTNYFDMMDTRLKVFTVSYLIWELQYWNEKGLLENRTARRAQAQVHLCRLPNTASRSCRNSIIHLGSIAGTCRGL